jgi:hypothetical protein
MLVSRPTDVQVAMLVLAVIGIVGRPAAASLNDGVSGSSDDHFVLDARLA